MHKKPSVPFKGLAITLIAAIVIQSTAWADADIFYPAQTVQVPSFFNRADVKTGKHLLEATLQYMLTLNRTQPELFPLEDFRFRLTPRFEKIGVSLELGFDEQSRAGDDLIIPCAVSGERFYRRYEARIDATRTKLTFRAPAKTGADRAPGARTSRDITVTPGGKYRDAGAAITPEPATAPQPGITESRLTRIIKALKQGGQLLLIAAVIAGIVRTTIHYTQLPQALSYSGGSIVILIIMALALSGIPAMVFSMNEGDYPRILDIENADSLSVAIERLSDKQDPVLYRLLFRRLNLDFDGARDFIRAAKQILEKGGVEELRTALNSDGRLFEKFEKIKENDTTRRTSIAFYGVLLFFLMDAPRPYTAHLYAQFIRTRPEKKIAMARRGISYQTRGNSIVHVYPKRLVYGDQTREYFRMLDPAYEQDIDKEIDVSNNAKVKKAVERWEKRAIEKFIAGDNDAFETFAPRIRNFKQMTTVLELDMPTHLIFSDPDRNVLRLIHTGRSRRVMYLPKKYLDSLAIWNDDDMDELAMWLNYGQRYLDMQDKLLAKKSDPQNIQRARAELTMRFFEKEDTLIVDHDALRRRLAGFMRQDTMLKYTDTLGSAMSRDQGADLILKKAENRYTELFGEAKRLGVDPSEYIIQVTDSTRELREYFNAAAKIYKELMHVYEGLGLRVRAERAFRRYQHSVSLIQQCETGELPYHDQRELVLNAMRFGKWEEFVTELKKFLTGKGYERKVRKSELTHIIFYITRPSPQDPTRKNFVDDIKHGIAAQFEASTTTAVRRTISRARRTAYQLLDRYFAVIDGGGVAEDNFANADIVDDVSTQEETYLKMRMGQWLMEFRPSNMPRRYAFRGWVFDRDMLFRAVKKWWRSRAIRWSPHGGIDMSRYMIATKGGKVKVRRIAKGQTVPTIFAGTVAAVIKDSIGSVIFVRHETIRDHTRLYTIYRYVDPASGIAVGQAVRPGEIIASVSDTMTNKTGIIPHVHVSLAYIDKDYPDSMLSLNTILTRDAQLINPLTDIPPGQAYTVKPIERHAKKKTTRFLPFLLTGEMSDYKFTRKDYSLVIPGSVLKEIYKMTTLWQYVRVRLSCRVVFKNGRALRADYIHNPYRIMSIVSAGAPDARLMTSRDYYDDIIRVFKDFQYSWARKVDSPEKAGDPALRRELGKKLDDLRMLLNRYDVGFVWYLTKKEGRIRFTSSMLNDIKAWNNEDLFKLAGDVSAVEGISSKWHEMSIFDLPPLQKGEEAFFIHTTPFGPEQYPMPPRAMPLAGSISGHIVETGEPGREAAELFLFYEPDSSNAGRYGLLKTRFFDWQEDVREDMRRLAMRPHPVEAGNGFQEEANAGAVRDDQTVPIEKGIVGRYDKEGKEFTFSSSDARPILRKLDDPGQLVTNMLETIFTMMIEGKRLVLAFHDDIALPEYKKLELCLRDLEKLKTKPGFERLLENLIILRPTKERTLRSSGDLMKALQATSVRVNDSRENTAIFMFAPNAVGNEFSGISPMVYPVLINEKGIRGKEFNPLTDYYPLLEIITLTLVKYRTRYSPAEIAGIMKRLGIDSLENLNIGNIDDKKTDTAYLIFDLIPKIGRLQIENSRDRYAILHKFLKTAA
ncbi:MAG: peptidoglycan DD-metalloendopeptidase family protein [Candidatus Omnitrophica bacterium]|nr:peptidoglycan DD-metalloendopeptidase family protein [Candidatus Omnitrophota bacterium]